MRNDLRPYTACFTGHREIKHNGLPEKLDALLETLIQQGFRYFGCGGAMGFDTLAALAVLKAREKNADVRLILVLPFPEQSDTWDMEERTLYESIKKRADRVVFTSREYHKGCFHVRNRCLVKYSSLCLAYQYKDSGGTAYTTRYAKTQGTKVMNLLER